LITALAEDCQWHQAQRLDHRTGSGLPVASGANEVSLQSFVFFVATWKSRPTTPPRIRMTQTAHSRDKHVKDAIKEMAAGAPGAPGSPARTPALRAEPSLLMRILAPLASLKLTVILFALGFVLVFMGTLALKHSGLWTAMKHYFRTPLAWVDLAIFAPDGKIETGKYKFPFPGGWTIGFLMLFNLIAAHSVRFQVKAIGKARLWGWIGMAAGTVILSLGLYAIVVSQPGITQTWWQGPGRVEGVSATTLGSAIVIYASYVLFAKRSGIFLTHAGIILLLIGELLTGLLAVESQMRIAEGETVNYSSNTERPELAFTYTDKTGAEQVVTVPQSMLKEGETLDDPRVPFKVKVEKYFINSDPVFVHPPKEAGDSARKAIMRAASNPDKEMLTEQEGQDALHIAQRNVVTPDLVKRMVAFFETTKPDFDSEDWRSLGTPWVKWHAYGGYEGREWAIHHSQCDTSFKTTGELGDAYRLRPRPENKGTEASSVDFPGAFVTIISKQGETLGTYMLQTALTDGQPVTDGGKEWMVALRFQRVYKPYSIHAKDVRADMFTGSSTPRNYSTQLLRYDAQHTAGEEAIIRMNEPMRFSGETFYQSQVAGVQKRDAQGNPYIDRAGATVLQVVSNPGYLLPYIACIVVSVGLMIHFGTNLAGYVRRNS
jgi:hypothetical protein